MAKMCKKGQIEINGQCFDKDLFDHLPSGIDIDISEHNYGFELQGDEVKLRLGNWTDAGWHWDGDEMDLAGFMIRMSTAGQGVREDFLEKMQELGITVNQLREHLIRSVQAKNGLYEITGDNGKWHFGQGDEMDEYSEKEHYQREYNLTDDEVEKFIEYSWNKSSDSHDYDAFEKSDEARDVIKGLLDAVTRATDWEDLFVEIGGINELASERSWEFSNEAQMNAMAESFDEWRFGGLNTFIKKNDLDWEARRYLIDQFTSKDFEMIQEGENVEDIIRSKGLLMSQFQKGQEKLPKYIPGEFRTGRASRIGARRPSRGYTQKRL